jgi:membrane dipeptidase
MTAVPHQPPASTSLHQDAIVVDLHNDIMLDVQSRKRDVTRVTPVGHSDLPRFREGGVDVQVFALFVHPTEADRGRQRVSALLDAFDRLAETNKAAVAAVTSVAEIRQAHTTGRLAVVLAVENASALEGDPDFVDVLFGRGVRMIGLTWNHSNALADGALESTHQGLTLLGRTVLARIQDVGMIVDVSHLSEKSFWDVIAATRGPIVATHSNAAGLTLHPRNLTDDQLRAVAERGGVVGVNFVPTFLGGASLAQVLEHVTYLVSVMGPDGVALGSDFDGFTGRVNGLEDVRRLPALTAGLLDRGYVPQTIRKILGENALRVFSKVWGR